MDLPIEAVLGGFAAMGAGMVALYRSQTKSQARCEANEIRMAKKIDELDRFQRSEMAAYAERSATLAATATPLLERALRVLRRHEQDATPIPESHPSEETTRFIRAKK